MLQKWFGRGHKPSYPPLTTFERAYVIGDVHGCGLLLEQVQRAIDQDDASGAGIEVYLGDYIDRGDDSRGVVERLIARTASRKTVLLRGNHELMFSKFLVGSLDYGSWQEFGVLPTLSSYGVPFDVVQTGDTELILDHVRERVPEAHLRFLVNLRDHAELDGYVFAHAGIRPGVPMAEQSSDDLLWIRDAFLNHQGDHGAVVVHGHTPRPAVEFMANRINLDVGAYATGRLACLQLRSDGRHRMLLASPGEPGDWVEI